MPPAAPVILLPPSEGKADGGDGPPIDWDTGTFGALGPMRRKVRGAVRRAIRDQAVAAKVLGARGAHLARAMDEWKMLDRAPTLPAALRYSGVVWGALDVPGLPAAVRRRLMARVVVPSGAWGLVAAGDPLPAYRLKMGARVDPLGLLSTWWRPVLTRALVARADRSPVFDLLPAEHAAAIDWQALRPGARVRVAIVDDGPAGRVAVGHAGKALKGALARAMLDADVRTAADVAALAIAGLGPGRVEDHGAAVVFARTS